VLAVGPFRNDNAAPHPTAELQANFFMVSQNNSKRRKDPEYFLERSGALLSQGKTDQAVKLLGDGLRAHRGDLQLSLRLGSVLMAKKNYDRAI
jgi:hypothetical protein